MKKILNKFKYYTLIKQKTVCNTEPIAFLITVIEMYQIGPQPDVFRSVCLMGSSYNTFSLEIKVGLSERTRTIIARSFLKSNQMTNI